MLNYLYQSHYIENAQGAIFYKTEYEILADFGPAGNTEKNFWADYEQLLRAVFLCFHGQKIGLTFFKKYPRVRTENVH